MPINNILNIIKRDNILIYEKGSDLLGLNLGNKMGANPIPVSKEIISTKHSLYA